MGRPVSCPECKTALRVESTNQKGHYVIRLAVAAELQDPKDSPQDLKPAVENKPLPKRSLSASIYQLVYSPLTAAWLLAIAVSLLIAVLSLSPKFRFARGRPVPGRTEPVLAQESPPPVAAASPGIQTVAEAPPQQMDQTPVQAIEAFPPISALEPVNMDVPLTLLPAPKMTEEKPETPVEVVKPVVKVNVPAKMAQKIAYYSQPKVRRRDLLEALQEQLGAPIRFDHKDLGTDNLDETVTFQLVDTTIGDVIKTVATSAGWEIVEEETGIRLERKRAAVNP